MKAILSFFVLSLLLPAVFSFGSGCNRLRSGRALTFPPPTTLPQNLKVAFIGDAGNNSNQKKVLELVKNWGAEFIIHAGDFEYADNPAAFENNLNAVLGPDYPYFASIGNHDYNTWEGTTGHKARLMQRLARFNATNNCVGDYGVNMACNYKGIYFVLSGVGTKGAGHASFIDQAFTGYNALWKVVAWHKNQKLMQIGGKPDETGWDVYEAARRHGAIISTGHEHSFCRSHLMSSFQSQVIASTSNTLQLSAGKSFVFVSGLAGVGIRSWEESLRKNPWWAAYGASNNNIQYGGLLCTFYINGNPREASCVFQDINLRVWDQFKMQSNLVAEDSFSSFNDKQKQQQQQQQFKVEFFEQQQFDNCRDTFIEVPVTTSNGDVFEDLNGQIHCNEYEIELSKGYSLFRFDNVPLRKGDRIKQANIQMFGAFSDKTQTPRYFISAHIGNSSQITCEENSPRYQISNLDSPFTTFTWTEDVAEDWETSTVWVSSDFHTLIEEVINSDKWSIGSSITLKIHGTGGQVTRSYDYSPCFAATLSVELDC